MVLPMQVGDPRLTTDRWHEVGQEQRAAEEARQKREAIEADRARKFVAEFFRASHLGSFRSNLATSLWGSQYHFALRSRASWFCYRFQSDVFASRNSPPLLAVAQYITDDAVVRPIRVAHQ